ncbi:MAG: hypothetical protein AseanaTS_24320 [Candidatus Pelagadaptatus aseana]|uniref:hypothetical protein n=1 Tax=Candidatus Pelagadaptatus aseana TaxID=3120508 RepID=UPI0039B1C82F
MGWLPIIICLAALALILGPIMLMQPTPAQRRETRLRNAALKRGLRVHYQPIPKGSDHNSGSRKQAVTYCLPWHEQDDIRNVWVLIKKSFVHDLHVFGDWDWLQSPSHMPEGFVTELEQGVNCLPGNVYALCSGPQGLCCFWNELGSENDVEAIADWLEQTAASISCASGRNGI